CPGRTTAGSVSTPSWGPRWNQASRSEVAWALGLGWGSVWGRSLEHPAAVDPVPTVLLLGRRHSRVGSLSRLVQPCPYGLTHRRRGQVGIPILVGDLGERPDQFLPHRDVGGEHPRR